MKYKLPKRRRLCHGLMAVMALFGSQAQASSSAYTYDDFGRLESVFTEAAEVNYQYDNVGNRTALTVQAGGLTTNIDIGIALSVSPGASQLVGNALTYTATVTNFSPTVATSLTLSFDLDDSSTLDSTGAGSWSCTNTDPAVCTLATLAGGTASQATFVVIPLGLSVITASANIAHGDADPQPANDLANASIEIISSGISGDADGDGLPDSWELEHGLNPFNAADADADWDGDNLTSLDEYQLGTDPNNVDTDGDGENDDVDANPTFNPAWLTPILNLLLD
ncbi:MAG: DUF11 domain-containing protein [Gammaproteobacteria bacterium]|nr:DUF11 domain-containing protein [Gammaproteobacteria bacterium]